MSIMQPAAPPTESGNYACLTWVGWRILVWVPGRGWFFPDATAAHQPAVMAWQGPLTPAHIPSYAPLPKDEDWHGDIPLGQAKPLPTPKPPMEYDL